MKIDEEFYKFQTKIRGSFTELDVITLCESERRRIEPVISEVIECIKKNEKSKVLDVPCGYGNLLYLYKCNGIEAFGIDLDLSQIDLAKKVGLNAEAGNFFNFSSESRFDLISSFDFIEHVSKSEALKILKKIYDLLNDGGLIILRTPCGDTGIGLRDFAEDPTHKWIGTSNCIESMLKMTGFKRIFIKEDWPVFSKCRLPRLAIAKSLRWLYRWLLKLMGYGSPRCLTSSMIVIASK